MRIVLLLTILFCVGCVSKKTPAFVPAHSRKIAVKLADSLGVLTMYVPERYDTGFVSGGEPDCYNCSVTRYYLQPSTRPVYLEGEGSDINQRKELNDHFTISHDYQLRLDQGDSTSIYKENRHFKEVWMAQGLEAEHFLIDTLYRIHDRPFAITGFYLYVAIVDRHCYELTAVTSVRGMDIRFNFELFIDKKDSISDHFVRNTLDLLQTVRFTKPM